MGKILSGIAKFIAFVFAFILVFALPLSLVAYNVGRVVFNRELVKRVVTDEVVSSDLIPIALEWFSDRRAKERVEAGEALVWVDEPDVVRAMAYLDRDDWREIKGEVLTDEFLAQLVAVTVDGVYDWIDNDQRVPQITWDLTPFIDRVNTEHGANSVEILYGGLPPCEPWQVADFEGRLAAAPPGAEVLYNLCEFPDPWYEDQHQDYINSLSEVVENVPQEFALTRELAETADDPQGAGPAQVKRQLRLIRLVFRLAPLIPLALLVVILVFGVRSLKGLGLWWGIPLTLGGLLALLPALVYRPVITRVLAAGPLSEAPDLIQAEAIRAIQRLAVEIFRPMLFQSLVILAIGLLLAIVGMVVKGKRATATDPATPAGVAGETPPPAPPSLPPADQPDADAAPTVASTGGAEGEQSSGEHPGMFG